MAQIDVDRLRIGEVVPPFMLPSMDGRLVSRGDYKQRLNLVIAYFDFNRCSACTNALRALAQKYEEYRELETEILVVSPQALGDLRGRIGAMAIPFPVLSDVEGKMASRYLGDGEENPAATIFVTDRYGELRMKLVACSTNDLFDQREILDELKLIEVECPE